MAPDPHVVAAAALDGPWRLDDLVVRLAACRGWGGPDEIGDVAALLLARWPGAPRTVPGRVGREVATLLAGRPRRRHVVPEDPPTPRWRWPVEPWTGCESLARGLDVDGGELDWFADRGGWPEGPLHHYRRRWTMSRSGTPRLLEVPGPRLMELQRRVGRKVLARIPVHDATHGYVRGRSPHTLAAEHAERAMVVRLDLEGFFSHVGGERLAGLLRTAGYPPAVASAVAGLLVTSTPRHQRPPSDPATGEVLGLAQERDRPPRRERDDGRVDGGPVVRGDDHRSVARDVLRPVPDGPPEQPGPAGRATISREDARAGNAGRDGPVPDGHRAHPDGPRESSDEPGPFRVAARNAPATRP